MPVCYGDVPLTEGDLREAMYKTAGTPYHCTDVRVAAQEGLAVSGTELDIARRKLLQKLTELREKAPSRREGGTLGLRRSIQPTTSRRVDGNAAATR